MTKNLCLSLSFSVSDYLSSPIHFFPFALEVHQSKLQQNKNSYSDAFAQKQRQQQHIPNVCSHPISHTLSHTNTRLLAAKKNNNILLFLKIIHQRKRPEKAKHYQYAIILRRCKKRKQSREANSAVAVLVMLMETTEHWKKQVTRILETCFFEKVLQKFKLVQIVICW